MVLHRRLSQPDLTSSEPAIDGRPSSRLASSTQLAPEPELIEPEPIPLPTLFPSPKPSPFPSRAPSPVPATPTPAFTRASTPMPSSDNVNFYPKLLEWMEPKEVAPVSPPRLGFGLPLAHEEDEDFKGIKGISDASPKWTPPNIAPEPYAPRASSMEFDADNAIRQMVSAAADATTSSYSSGIHSPSPRETTITPLWTYHAQEALPHHEWPLRPNWVPHSSIDPRTADIVVFAESPRPPVSSTIRESKKRKRGDVALVESGAGSDYAPESRPNKATKKVAKSATKKASAVTPTVRKSKGKATQSAPAPVPQSNAPRVIVRAFPTDITSNCCTELYSLLGDSQVWSIRDDDQLPHAPGVLFYARALRPINGGKNGLVLKDKSEIESLVFAQCTDCGRAAAKTSLMRHVICTPKHYPRIREHALPTVRFKWFWCDVCNYSQERKDTWDDRHGPACNRHKEPADAFCHRLEDPRTCKKIQDIVRGLRQEYIDTDLKRLARESAITDQLVSEMMSSWDVLPDALCEEIQRRASGRYHCFTEAQVKARDDALAAPTKV